MEVDADGSVVAPHRAVVVVVNMPPGRQGARVVGGDEVDGVVPVTVVDVVDGTKIVVVDGAHGTVVVDGLPGMQGGTVVGGAGSVTPVVVVRPGTNALVVVEPGVGSAAQPSDCDNESRIRVATGEGANVAASERTRSHTRPRTDGSSWANAVEVGPWTPWALLNSGWATTTSAHSPTAQIHLRRLAIAPPPFPVRPPMRPTG